MRKDLFRVWLQNKYMEYKNEKMDTEGFGASIMTDKQYLNEYKWYLKKLYKLESENEL